MLYSKLFGKTTRTVSRDAVVASHKLLLQAGFIRQLSTGRYSMLPLGFRVSKKIEDVIRTEVEKTGAQELIVPTLHPIELWRQANRDKKFGSSMMQVVDRNGAEFTLSATAEVVMLDLVKKIVPSYKDLPINIFQFSQKFRDEVRPSGGLLRVKEFVMKDSYSFDIDESEHQKIYKAYWKAYENIAKKLELDITIVESDNGAIGGAISHEFMVETDVGEDTIVKCSCGYAANLERAVFVKESINLSDSVKKMTEVQAIRGTTMEDGVKLHGLPLNLQIKSVVYVDEKGRFILAIIRGDYTVNETKLKNMVHSVELRYASEEEIINTLHSVPGFISPVGIKQNIDPKHGLVVVVDDSLRTVKNCYGGSNKKNVDLLNINIERDYKPDFEGDIANASKGDICGFCKKHKLNLAKTVEFGNIFNIGYAYSDPMDGNFVNKDGGLKKIYMGSYGIGVGRALALIVEIHHDDKGIIWPKSITPYQVHLIGLDLFNEDVKKQAANLYQKLLGSSIDVLFDDRFNVMPGVKFADADLIGIPLRIIISKRSLEKGGFEFRLRTNSCSKIVNKKELFKELKSFY